MNLNDYARVLRARWFAVLLITLVGLILGLSWFFLTPKKYESSAQLYVSVREESGTPGELAQSAEYARQAITTYLEFIETDSVINPALETAHVSADTDVRIAASSPRASQLINITATATDPTLARDVAQSTVASFTEQAEKTIDGFSTSESDGRLQLSVTQPAGLPSAPTWPSLPLAVALGLLGGFAIGIISASVRFVTTSKVLSSDDVRSVQQVTVIGETTRGRKKESAAKQEHIQAETSQAEQYRRIRSHLEGMKPASTGLVVTVTAAGAAVDAINPTIEVARVLVEGSRSVVLIDCDLRGKELSNELQLDSSREGLSDLLLGNIVPTQALRPLGSNRLFSVAAGSSHEHPSDILSSSRMSRLLEGLRTEFDFIFLVTPAVTSFTDATVAASKSDSVIIVAECETSRRSDVEMASRDLVLGGSRNVFAVVTNIDPRLATPSVAKYGS